MRRILIFILATCTMLSSCRDDEYVDFSEEEPIQEGVWTETWYDALYLLNEGNMGSNHCTLDYLDFGTGTYHRNIYGQRNPSVVKELGDVGNDIQIYGSKLWIVVNGSNKVEICEASSAQRIAQVDIPNGRYLAFDGGYAYVSSYVGPIALSGDAQLGRVYKVDTLSLQKVDSVVVGYQPEEMAIIGRNLYVANSGGYRAPQYDNRISCIDLDHFAETPAQIEVGINLHRMEADRFGKLWVSSRGDYQNNPGLLYCLSPDTQGAMQVIDRIEIPVAEMQLVGDELWYLASTWDNLSGTAKGSFGIIDIRTRQKTTSTLFDAPEIAAMHTPYGMLINPESRDFYLMDARNYVSSGQLLHFLPDGTFDWSMRTGDIPSRAVLVQTDLRQVPAEEAPLPDSHITVLEYRPAPGQFINILPSYQVGDDAGSMAQKCSDALNNREMICLGGFGGSITFRFEKVISNQPGNDFRIFGNAITGNSEPGIVQVSVDINGNGLPDDPWYELAGSADTDSIGKCLYGYQITYYASPMADIPWRDNQGESGVIARNSYHTQEYFPQWLTSELVYEGTRLPNNAILNGSQWSLGAYRYGYVDNLPGTDDATCGFDLDWAVDPITRQRVQLTRAHFVRVYTALNQSCGWLGETSTEITGAQLIDNN